MPDGLLAEGMVKSAEKAEKPEKSAEKKLKKVKKDKTPKKAAEDAGEPLVVGAAEVGPLSCPCGRYSYFTHILSSNSCIGVGGGTEAGHL